MRWAVLRLRSSDCTSQPWLCHTTKRWSSHETFSTIQVLRGHPENPGSKHRQKTSPNVRRNFAGGELRRSQNPAQDRRRTCDVARSPPPNKVLLGPPPEVDPAERMLPRPYRSTLSQLRSGYCSRLQSYLHRVGRAPSPACPDCGSAPHTTEHLFSCPESPTDLVPADLWTAPLQAAQFISSLPAFSDLPPFPVIPGGPFPPPPRPPPEPPP